MQRALTMNCLSYTLVGINVVLLWWSPTASEVLSYGLHFPEGACPNTPSECCVLYPYRQLRAVHATPPSHYMYVPLL